MSDDQSTNGGSWYDHLPWLILFRCFRPAVGVRMLVLGAGGIVANVAGWRILYQLFKGSEDSAISGLRTAVDLQSGVWPHWPWAPGMQGTSATDSLQASIGTPSIVDEFMRPLTMLVNSDVSFVGFTFALLCILWAVLVWSYFGAAMTRTAALRLCRDEPASWSDVGGFSLNKFPSFFAAPLFPLLGILLAMIPVALLGLIANIPAVGMFITGLLFPIALLCGLFMTIIAIGYLFGWPFMWSTISTEGTDAFDALSRAYAYVYQRPLHYLFYAVVAMVLGSLGYFVVNLFANGVACFTIWAASWGMSDELLGPIHSYLAGGGSAELGWGASLIVFWVQCVKLIATGYLASYFWTATTAIYLLLRRDVDATEMNEVYLTDEEETYSLPSLTTNDAGETAAPATGTSDDSGSDVE